MPNLFSLSHLSSHPTQSLSPNLTLMFRLENDQAVGKCHTIQADKILEVNRKEGDSNYRMKGLVHREWLQHVESHNQPWQQQVLH